MLILSVWVAAWMAVMTTAGVLVALYNRPRSLGSYTITLMAVVLAVHIQKSSPLPQLPFPWGGVAGTLAGCIMFMIGVRIGLEIRERRQEPKITDLYPDPLLSHEDGEK
ncbi:MAG: hypothetical protein NUV78_02085 [Candidatus Zambryskibacteria bacterium]|nr:hypothetical protein [Candidatus Zambryskibacteria bacterium]